MVWLSLLLGFVLGIAVMTISAIAIYYKQREQAVRNNKYLLEIYRWFYKGDPIEYFPIGAINSWAESWTEASKTYTRKE